MAHEEEQQSEPRGPDPTEQLPNEPDPRLASWLERSRGQTDDAERR